MADEPVVQQDTTEAPVESSTPPEDTGSEEGATSTPAKLLFGKFKDETEAEKAYRELERKLGEQGSEVGNLRKELSSVQERTQLSDVLTKLSERMEHKQPEVDFEKFADELSAGMAENPTEATKKLLKAVGSWTASDRDTLLKEIKSLKGDIEKIRGDLTEKLETSDDFYIANKEMINEMVQGGMRLGEAKNFLKKIVQDKDVGRGSAKVPATVSGGSRTAAKSNGSYLTADDRADMKRDGFTDGEIEEMEATYKRNVARNEREQRERAGA